MFSTDMKQNYGDWDVVSKHKLLDAGGNIEQNQ